MDNELENLITLLELFIFILQLKVHIQLTKERKENNVSIFKVQ